MQTTICKYRQKYNVRLEGMLYRFLKCLLWIRQNISSKWLFEVLEIKSLKEIIDEIQNRKKEVVKEERKK